MFNIGQKIFYVLTKKYDFFFLKKFVDVFDSDIETIVKKKQNKMEKFLIHFFKILTKIKVIYFMK